MHQVLHSTGSEASFCALSVFTAQHILRSLHDLRYSGRSPRGAFVPAAWSLCPLMDCHGHTAAPPTASEHATQGVEIQPKNEQTDTSEEPPPKKPKLAPEPTSVAASRSPGACVAVFLPIACPTSYRGTQCRIFCSISSGNRVFCLLQASGFGIWLLLRHCATDTANIWALPHSPRGSISAPSTRRASFFDHSPPVPVFASTSPNNLEYLLTVSKNLAHPLHPVHDDGKGGSWKWWE